MSPSTTPVAPPRQYALFVYQGSFSGTNDNLLAALRARRPEINFDALDVKSLFVGDMVSVTRCAIGALREYGVGSLLSPEVMRRRMTRNQVHFSLVHKRLRAWIDQRNYLFSLQTQSLFDASNERFPNYVYTDHVARARENAQWDDRMGAPSRRWLACETEIYNNAAHVFSFGSQIRHLLIDRYGLPEEKVSRVGAGASVIPERLPTTDLARYARRNVLFVGVEWERKGGPDLLAAFKILRTRMPDATLTIVGCSPIEAKGVAGCVALGRLTPSEVAHHFHEASCFCMPSRLEPFGIVYAEAAHFALPIVASTVGDIGDMVHDGENGWRTSPCDPTALAAALERVLADPETARRMGLAGAALAQDWTWDAVAERILTHAAPPQTS